MLASRQHIQIIFGDCRKSVSCACKLKGGMLGAEALGPMIAGSHLRQLGVNVKPCIADETLVPICALSCSEKTPKQY
jgi:hypothetical protein